MTLAQLQTLNTHNKMSKNKVPMPTHDDVMFEGHKLVIPEVLTGKYDAARDLITQYEKSRETAVNVYADVAGFPLDVLVALRAVMEETFGFTTTGAWATSISVTTADGSRTTGIQGQIKPPAWEGGHISATINGDLIVALQGTVKKKHEEQFRAIVRAVESKLALSSIYKGQAFRLDLSWLEDGNGYNPIKDQPKFMTADIASCPELILADTTHHLLATSLYLPIVATDVCRRRKIPIKRGIMLAGPYGCGKSLTAQTTAKLCVANNWTFVYLTTPTQFVAAYRIAQHFAPCVLFVEDADAILSGQRDETLNAIFNTLSGVDTKNAEVVTVFTTNNPDKIHPGIMRAERIDRVVYFGHPDASCAERFVSQYAKDDRGRSLLVPNIDLAEVGIHLAGFSPAFIRAAVEAAKSNALYHGRELIDATDLIVAADAYTEQRKLVERSSEPSKAQRLISASRLLGEAFSGELAE